MIISKKPSYRKIDKLQMFLKQNTVYDLMSNNNCVLSDWRWKWSFRPWNWQNWSASSRKNLHPKCSFSITTRRKWQLSSFTWTSSICSWTTKTFQVVWSEPSDSTQPMNQAQMTQFLQTTDIGRYLRDFGKIDPELNQKVFYCRVIWPAQRLSRYGHWEFPTEMCGPRGGAWWRLQKHFGDCKQAGSATFHHATLQQPRLGQSASDRNPAPEDCASHWVDQVHVRRPADGRRHFAVQNRKGSVTSCPFCRWSNG